MLSVRYEVTMFSTEIHFVQWFYDRIYMNFLNDSYISNCASLNCFLSVLIRIRLHKTVVEL